MSEPAQGDARTLADLRQNIDAIDGELHRLLIDRAAVIDTLIRVKGTTVAANAFRPGREAAMMRRLVADHTGALPIATVEHIWREIITTFTRLQTRFSIATDISSAPEGMRDLARFYFGFSVDVESMPDPNAVVARVAQNYDLGLVGLGEPEANGAWWRDLVGAAAPRVMAHLPFIRGGARSPGPQALVISPPLADPTPPEIGIYAVHSQAALPEATDVTVLASHHDSNRWDSLAAAAVDAGTLSARLGVARDDVAEVGGIARGIALDGTVSVLYAPINPAGDA
ncbi:MAG: chorismate mutase [Hyphomicrobiales bacterium]|nr:chorismate mutase [Hyphomicrobiales bacterium]